MSKDFQAVSSRRFTRHQRLSQPKEFKKVFTHGKRTGDEYFSVLGHNNHTVLARLGLGIARRHIRSSVGRNRIKRLVRESFRQHQTELTGLDIVVLLRRDVTPLANTDVSRRLNKHWQDIIKKCRQS